MYINRVNNYRNIYLKFQFFHLFKMKIQKAYQNFLKSQQEFQNYFCHFLPYFHTYPAKWYTRTPCNSLS